MPFELTPFVIPASFVIPAKAGIHLSRRAWTPASAGVTVR